MFVLFRMKNESGFTLIEMLIVLMIITVLIILLIPNLTDRSTQVHDKGCKALVATVQAQVNAYQLDVGKLPTSLDELANAKYIKNDQKKCSNGKELSYNNSNGVVNVAQN